MSLPLVGGLAARAKRKLPTTGSSDKARVPNGTLCFDDSGLGLGHGHRFGNGRLKGRLTSEEV